MTKNNKIKKLNLFINLPNKQLKTELIQYQNEHKIISQHKLLELIWNSFKHSKNSLNLKEQELIDHALAISNLSIEELQKQSLLKAAKNIIKKNQVSPLEEINKNSRTSTKAADLRIAEIVAEMILSNNQSEEWYQRKFINQRSISEYAKKRKNFDKNNLSLNVIVIKRYLDKHQETIFQHHLKHNLQKNHNSKVFNFLRIQKF